MNKQIIKMAKDLCHARDCHIKDEPTECYHGCKAWVYAERAVNKGYRKSTDVAREIFAEIEGIILSKMPDRINLSKKERDYFVGVILGKRDAFLDIINNLAELKKKYESEGADDEN